MDGSGGGGDRPLVGWAQGVTRLYIIRYSTTRATEVVCVEGREGSEAKDGWTVYTRTCWSPFPCSLVTHLAQGGAIYAIGSGTSVTYSDGGGEGTGGLLGFKRNTASQVKND